MRLLVLGGTSWLGGAVAAEAVARGFDVTCLARGESGAVPQGATLVPADRWQEGAYHGLPEFEAAVEVSWQPALVASALEHVHASHWVYVSSVSVYADRADAAAGTGADLLPAWQGSGEAGREEYGGAKVACEAAYAAHLEPSRFVVARAGLIAGYGDRSDRLGYWPGRIAQATGDRSRVLVPEPAQGPVQAIDVLDLAAWLVHCAAERVSGVYDAVGPRTFFQAVLDASVDAAGTSPSYAWAGADFLVEQGVGEWMGPESLPLWVADAAMADFMTRSTEPAEGAGLALRPVKATVADALRWERELGLDRRRTSGLSAEREAELLDML